MSERGEAGGAQASGSEIRAVLFDVDGTLLVTGGAGAEAWRRAFRELHGVEAEIGEGTWAGLTDPEIAALLFRQVLGRDGEAAELERALAAYLNHLPAAVSESSGYQVLPGVEALLSRLTTAGLLLGLVTGNLEPGAQAKLARGGLGGFFACGGYGSDSGDRAELTRRALERAAALAGRPLAPDGAIAVGDTPRDVRAGQAAGIRVVGVASGAFTAPELAAAGANWTLETLERGFPL